MSSKAGAPKGLRGSEELARTRILLTLWDLGGVEKEVNKGELTERLKRTNERASDYKGVLEELEKAGAIAIGKNQLSLTTPTGLQMLEEALKNPAFEFDGQQVGTKLANAVLKWLRQSQGGVSATAAPAKPAEAKAADAIASYDKFKEVALDVYDRLNRDYNLDDLVPIYRIRREIGDRVSRSHFNEWLLEMQAKDILQLQGGSLPDGDLAKIEDSITTELSGLRCYAKRLTP